MRIIALINGGEALREILLYLGDRVEPQRIVPAHGPPAWEGAGAAATNYWRSPCRTSNSINGSRGKRRAVQELPDGSAHPGGVFG